MRKCKRCKTEEEKQFKKTGQMFTSPFGFCAVCHAKFVPLLKQLKQYFCERKYPFSLRIIND
jgi:hypothetical protein